MWYQTQCTWVHNSKADRRYVQQTKHGNQKIVVRTVIRLWAGWPRVWILAEAWNFPLLQNIQRGSGGPPTFTSNCCWNSSPGDKQPGCDADPHLHIMQRVRMSGVTDLLPLNAIMMSTWTTYNWKSISAWNIPDCSQISGSSITNVDTICNYFSKTFNYKLESHLRKNKWQYNSSPVRQEQQSTDI